MFLQVSKQPKDRETTPTDELQSELQSTARRLSLANMGACACRLRARTRAAVRAR